MIPVHETAYPRLKSDPTLKDLADVYTLTADEITLVERIAKRPVVRTAALLYLKLFQRLGYFLPLKDVPVIIRDYIVAQNGGIKPPTLAELKRFELSGTRQTVMAALRRHLDVRPLDTAGNAWLGHIAETAADTKHTIADIINVMLEELVHHRYELPAFSSLDRIASRAREKLHQEHFSSITDPGCVETMAEDLLIMWLNYPTEWIMRSA